VPNHYICTAEEPSSPRSHPPPRSSSSGPALAKSEVSPEDERFMRMALDEARQGDYAFGCVITRDGAVIAQGHNLGKTNDDPTAHGEMMAIRRCLAER
jgi:tRNA(adenine34) deaminase